MTGLQKGIGKQKLAIALCRVGDSTAELEEAREYIEKSGYYLLDGALPERTGYRRASDAGRCASETPYPSLNERAGELAQAIVDRVNELTETDN